MKLDNRSQFVFSVETVPATPSRWQMFVQTLLDRMTGSGEPKIYHRRDRQGNSYLEVHDPLSGKTQSFSTANEVRIWLEQRYSA
jgi:hypothetical protein